MRRKSHWQSGISIHASLAGGDDSVLYNSIKEAAISIHASLAGGDYLAAIFIAADDDFNPRLPRGRRPDQAYKAVIAGLISIHASLAGGDAGDTLLRAQDEHFNPRLPRGRRRAGAR